jgi:hypothetical protein
MPQMATSLLDPGPLLGVIWINCLSSLLAETRWNRQLIQITPKRDQD